MPTQDEAVWHVLIDNVQLGPMKRSEILASLRDGTIGGANLIWRPGFADWLSLREVGEFSTPPPERKPEAAPPPIAHPDVSTKTLPEKWSLWRAATIGLAVTSFSLLPFGFTTGWYRLASVGHAPNADVVAEFLGELLWLPLLFVLIAMIRNTVDAAACARQASVRAFGRRPSSAS